MALSTYDSRRRGQVVRPKRRMKPMNPSVPIPTVQNPAQGLTETPRALEEHQQTTANMQGFAKILDNDPVAGRELQRVQNMAQRIMDQEPDPQKAAELVKAEIQRWRTQGMREE